MGGWAHPSGTVVTADGTVVVVVLVVVVDDVDDVEVEAVSTSVLVVDVVVGAAAMLPATRNHVPKKVASMASSLRTVLTLVTALTRCRARPRHT